MNHFLEAMEAEMRRLVREARRDLSFRMIADGRGRVIPSQPWLSGVEWEMTQALGEDDLWDYEY